MRVMLFFFSQQTAHTVATLTARNLCAPIGGRRPIGTANEQPGDADRFLGAAGGLGVTARLVHSKKSTRVSMHIRLL